MRICPKCRQQITDKSDTCVHCGQSLKDLPRCPECGALLLKEQKQCHECGFTIKVSPKKQPLGLAKLLTFMVIMAVIFSIFNAPPIKEFFDSLTLDKVVEAVKIFLEWVEEVKSMLMS